jgi:beta-N-acetylhexosaminidase
MDISSFSDELLAGQRLMIGFDGTRLDQDLRFMIDNLKIGGIVLFSRNLVDPAQIRQLTQDIQAYAEKCSLPPLIVSIDQEGGVVARLKPPFTQFPGNPHMKNASDAVGFAETTATELAGIGVNMDLAPVMDVAFEKNQSVMADRAFGHDPERVSHLGKIVIEALQQRNIMAVAKHFPGIGRTELDSHMDLPDLDIDPDLLMKTDIVPFQTAISGDVAGIMLSHIMYPKLDNKWPASLSGAIAKDLLRNRLGYQGVVMTDDLDMGAIDKHFGFETAVDQILAADIDIVMICHRSPKMETAHERILSDIKRSHENRQRTIRSVLRIMHLKERYL